MGCHQAARVLLKGILRDAQRPELCPAFAALIGGWPFVSGFEAGLGLGLDVDFI
jgi:hypothetical protein